MSADMSGFCPACRTWLGRSEHCGNARLNALERYELWCSSTLADLIDRAESIALRPTAAITETIEKLIAHHHSGVAAHFARQIGRNKSVVATWLAARASPRWEALCAISYVYQVSLASLIAGDVCAEAPTKTPLDLPDAVYARHNGVRKQPVARNRSQMISLMERIQAGMEPEITSIAGIADQLGVNVRDLYALAPDAVRKTSAALALRATQRQVERAALRAKAQSRAAEQVAAELSRLGGRVSRRVVEAAMAKMGYVVPWEESKSVVDMVCQQMALACAVDYGASDE